MPQAARPKPNPRRPQPETPSVSAKLSQAVNAPVFVPKSSPLLPASPTLSRAQAQTPLTAYVGLCSGCQVVVLLTGYQKHVVPLTAGVRLRRK
jgi:hypothetical protein